MLDVDCTAKRHRRLAYIAQLAVPPGIDQRPFRRLLGGSDEVVAFRGLLESLEEGDAFELVGIHVDKGEEPDLSYDAVIVGGSFASVNDRHPWQTSLSEWLLRYRATGRPLLGICGGHQIASTSLGGSVERRETGMVLGTLPAQLSEAGRRHWLFEGMGNAPLFQFAHFDHVVRAPASATILGTCIETIAALDLGGNWVSTQFHPEIACDRLAAYYHAAVADDQLRFAYAVGTERLIGNFLRRVIHIHKEKA
jgi:GMP synthase-like glutamine amidotransferase